MNAGERGDESGIVDIADNNTPNHDAPVLNDDVEDGADDVVIFAEDVDPGFDDDPMIIANLDIDEDDWDGSLDEAADTEPEVVKPTKIKRGVQLDYMCAINDQLKVEVQDKTKAFEKKWLIEHLANNDGWVRKEQAQSIIKYLKSSDRSPSTNKDVAVIWKPSNKLYYRDIKAWLPEILLPGGCPPFCPTCKSNSHVSRRAFHSNHIGRTISSLIQNYHVLTCQYQCGRCEEKKKELERAATAAAAATNEAPTKVDYKYTFMGWDPDSVPLTAYGCGDQSCASDVESRSRQDIVGYYACRV